MRKVNMFKATLIATTLGLASLSAQAYDLSKGIDAAVTLGKAATVSDSDMALMAREAAKVSDKKNRVAPAGNKYAVRLAKLTKGLTNYDGLNLNFKAYLTQDVNAFAMADGTVRVYSGLMDMMNDNELLSVIGHEIGHVKNGHTKKHTQAIMMAAAARTAASGAGGWVSTLTDSQLGDITEKLISAQYSQSNEKESDSYGMRLLKAKGIDPNASVTALQKLAALGDSGGLLASHPAPGDRAKRIASEIKSMK